ncbi:MAG: hypothetical protein KDE53_34080 [Caldilineaceae bacterium]|nr:hypothetical protein [Caldilineaceae bacterium]
MSKSGNGVALATTYHDPLGVLYPQLQRHLPFLQDIFGGIAANVSPDLHQPTLELLRSSGVDLVQQARNIERDGVPALGQVRRAVIAQALSLETPFVMYCDGDRVLHWAERYPEELATVIKELPAADFTVLGRTPRAFASHPRIQSETEAIINQLYATISGRNWDITAAARGLSRAVAQAIVDDCADNSIGVDAAWPLFVQARGGFTMRAVATEGLEFETATQYPDAVATAGSEEAWKAGLDADPNHWVFRLNVARVEVQSMVPYQRVANGQSA